MVATILMGLLLFVAVQGNETSPHPPSIASQDTASSAVTQLNTVDSLDGKTLFVRQYADWQNAPGEFELLPVPIKGRRITIRSSRATEHIFVVVTAEDQEDRTVREAVGDRIWAQSLQSKLDLWLPLSSDENRESPRWQFTDALGEPLAGASVEIWPADFRGPRIRFGQATLDSAGQLVWKVSQSNPLTIYFIVSHADYGSAEVRMPFEPDARIITTPLVRRGTVAAERAIRGRIVDPDGAPVAGATIDCSYIRTLGEGLINAANDAGKGVTEADGGFSFYLLNSRIRDDRGELIPPKSRYHVRIEAPRSFGLLPYADPIENGRETLVVLERGDRLRRLRFEDQNGQIADPTKLQAITVMLRRPEHNILSLQYDDWKDGVPLVPGRYEASMRTPHEECRFEPVELTQDSPEELVFRLPAGVTYYGRVVHGITGQPMPGAFVLAMSSTCSDMRLEDLTAEQWAALHKLENNPTVENEALAPLRKIYGFVKAVRTDATGVYGVALEADESFYGFIAFEQGYLAVMQRKHSLTADQTGFTEVPPIGLFPAATVVVETSADKEHLSIMPTWQIDETTRPEWVQELLAVDNGQESHLECHGWVKPNARQRIHVPAGVGLRLTLETPYDEEFCPIPIEQPICLARGQTADLGQFTFELAVPVQVKAVDSDGHALEGIPVHPVRIQPDGVPCWGVPHITDDQGIARFHVPPNSTGSFGVFFHDDAGVNMRETTEYKVAGRDDAEHEFVLSISDEMLAHLLK
ncbi:MAG: carboxypeptidase-like regulatory domain-containing protein [Solirubrobacterales bacterium]